MKTPIIAVITEQSAAGGMALSLNVGLAETMGYHASENRLRLAVGRTANMDAALTGINGDGG